MWNVNEALDFYIGQPLKRLSLVALVFGYLHRAVYVREWGRSTLSAEVGMRHLKRDCHGLPAVNLAGPSTIDKDKV